MEGVMQCVANYVPLTPISFLERAARVYPDEASVIYGDVTFTWKITHQRCMKLASALSSLGVSYGDFVVALMPNIPELYELHFGVALAGGVLSAMNPMLEKTTLSTMLKDLGPKFIFVDHPNVEDVLHIVNNEVTMASQVVCTSSISNSPNQSSDYLCYNELLDLGQLDNFEPIMVKNECEPILVNYTSGSTGGPKAVVYSHRATYLNTIGEILRSDFREQKKVVFLWTADMFRANGWGFTWAIAAVGGTNVFPLNMKLFDSVYTHNVTHLSGNPNVLSTIIEEHDERSSNVLPHKVYAHIAGVLPSCEILNRIKKLGFEVIHRYGMTEILGPPVVRKLENCCCANKLNNNANFMDHIMEEFDVKDPGNMQSVPWDSKTVGEVMFKGNALMMGYFKAPKATQNAFKGGWFHTGDLAVRKQDGCIQFKDRAIDVIKSKGELISSLEIEAVLLTHPKVVQAAVVAIPFNNVSIKDEVPCAFLKLKIGEEANETEIVQFCSERLPSHMTPKVIIFGNIAITSTGKVQKFVLREVAKRFNSRPS